MTDQTETLAQNLQDCKG